MLMFFLRNTMYPFYSNMKFKISQKNRLILSVCQNYAKFFHYNQLPKHLNNYYKYILNIHIQILNMKFIL